MSMQSSLSRRPLGGGVPGACLGCARPRVRHVTRATTTDHALRVRGDSKRVSTFLSDVGQWKLWHPGMKSVQRLGSALDPIKPGSRWEAHQKAWTIDLLMKYELLEYTPGKKVVVSGLSQYHTVMHQFILMVDRHDPQHTSIRHISDVQLREWRSALQPVLSKLLASTPEEGMQQLQALLNGPDTPLYSGAFEASKRSERQASSSGRRGQSSDSGAGDRRSRRQAEPRMGSTSSGSSMWDSFAEGLFGTRSGSSSPKTTTSSRSAVAEAPAAPVADPMGYYAALGFSIAAGGAGPSQEEVKGSYRKLAMQWHPDRHTASDKHMQKVAADRFAQLMQAYNVLKDEETRSLYDRGLYYEETTVL